MLASLSTVCWPGAQLQGMKVHMMAVSLTVLLRVTMDIIPVLHFHWYQPIIYKLADASFSSQFVELHGYLLGMAHNLAIKWHLRCRRMTHRRWYAVQLYDLMIITNAPISAYQTCLIRSRLSKILSSQKETVIDHMTFPTLTRRAID